MLTAVLAPSGFNFSYTTDTADLNAANLAKYDALLIYSNHRTIAAPQEKALLDFVAGGKGLIALHSASFCSKIRAPYIALLGAVRAARHRRVDRGIRQSLARGAGRAAAVLRSGKSSTSHEIRPPGWYRPDGAGPKARAASRGPGSAATEKAASASTAYGHDERVWGRSELPRAHRERDGPGRLGVTARPSFSTLAIRPRCRTRTVRRDPDYERRNPAPRFRQPALDGEAAKHMQIPPASSWQLFAAEPLITGNPVAMAWDERGRLRLAETSGLSQQPATGRPGKRCHKDLEDTNRDGRADKATVFADKPTHRQQPGASPTAASSSRRPERWSP